MASENGLIAVDLVNRSVIGPVVSDNQLSVVMSVRVVIRLYLEIVSNSGKLTWVLAVRQAG